MIAFLVNNYRSLYSICEPVLVFLQTSFFALSRGSSVCPETAPRCCCIAQRRLPWPFLLCAVVINKSLKPSASIGPSLVLCLIHCRSPTPSAIYFVSQSFEIFSLGDPPALDISGDQSDTSSESISLTHTRTSPPPSVSV